MDVARSLINRIVFTQDVQAVLERGIHPRMIMGDPEARDVFRFILSYYNQYRATPSLDMTQEKFPEFPFEYAKEPLGYYADELVKWYARNRQIQILKRAHKTVNDDPMRTLDTLRSDIAGLSVETNPTKDVELSQTVDERKGHYELMEKLGGLDGLLTPWYSFDEVNGGIHPEELIMVVAASGVGKSWWLIVLADHLYNAGKNVLAVTNEMSTQQFSRRWDAVHFHLPYKQFKAGMLSEGEKKLYFDGLDKLSENKNWVRFVGDRGMTVSQIAAKVEQYKPDVLIVDGIYLLNDDRGAHTKWERNSNVVEDLKKLAQQYTIPVVCSSQFDRSIKEVTTEADLTNLGFSMDIGRTSDVVIGLFRSKELRQAHQMKMQLIKVREGARKPIMLNWDFQSMTFTELVEEEVDRGNGRGATPAVAAAPRS